MKRLSKNMIIFIIAFAIVGIGWISSDIIPSVKNVVSVSSQEKAVYGRAGAFNNATANTEKALTENLSYHNTAMDINSLFNLFIGTAVVEKDDSTVVRVKNGMLLNPRPKAKQSTLERYADNVSILYETAKKNGAEFLYVMAPTKGYAQEYPKNVEDYTVSNCDRFSNLLQKDGIPFLNLVKTAKAEGISEEDMFFVTDHHWKPQMGIWAADRVSNALGEKYGFQYDKALFDVNNYRVSTYKNWFLGSQGKKVGQYFTIHGADDIDLYVPKFPTSFIEWVPSKYTERVGSFEEVMLYKENIKNKDLYNLNPYAAYSGGDFREQILVNKLKSGGKRALVIRDSYGCAFTPFFALAFDTTYVVDIRDGGYAADKLELSSYIETVKPDYVIVLYTGVSANDSLYRFTNTCP